MSVADSHTDDLSEDRSSSGKTGAPRRARTWFWRVGRTSLIVYCALAVMLYFLQTWLIFPGRSTQGDPGRVVRQVPRGGELVHLSTAKGNQIVAAFGHALGPNGEPRPDAASRPTILYFYGNAMSLWNAVYQLDDFRRLGANVLIPEYVGYGMSSGDASEAGCYETADAAYDYLLGRSDIDPSRIIAVGWSLGAAVAIDLASRRPLAGLASFSCFTSVADMGRRTYPFLPVSLLLKHRFDNASKIALVATPTIIGHGLADSIIPFDMSEQLAAAAGGPVIRVSVTTADHNDFFDVGWDEIVNGFRDLFAQVEARRQTAAAT